MPNSDYLMTEEELDKAEEAGNLTPVESKSPGNEQPAQPYPGERTAPYFSGSMPPQFQLDSNFSRARVTSDRVPKFGLMPFAPNANPSTNASIQSTATKVVESFPVVPSGNANQFLGIPLKAGVPVDQAVYKFFAANNDWEAVRADGVEHGDQFDWWSDSGFVFVREDFDRGALSSIWPSISSLTGVASANDWAHFGTSSSHYTFGGNPPHVGIFGWTQPATSSGFAGIMLNTVGDLGGATNVTFRTMALLENPGWKMSWVFTFPGTAGNGVNNAPDWSKKSFYLGLVGPGISAVHPSNGAMGLGSSARPDCFFGLRYDTSHVPESWGLNSVAANAGGNTVYTPNTGATAGLASLPGANTYLNCTFKVVGSNSNNNGTFTCVASSTTTVTLNNPNGVLESSSPNTAVIYPVTLNITAVTANSPSAGFHTYTFPTHVSATGTAGTNGGYIGQSVTITGCTNAANNGTFTVVGSWISGANTLIAVAGAGVTEVPTANAAFIAFQDAPNDFNGNFKFEYVNNSQWSNGQIRHNAAGTVVDTGIKPSFQNWYRLDMVCTVAGQITVSLLDENAGVVFSNLFTIPKITQTTGSLNLQTDANHQEPVLISVSSASTNTIPGSNGTPFPQFGDGSVVTFSGFTGGAANLNGTFNLLVNNMGLSSWTGIVLVPGGISLVIGQTGTISGYPAFAPIVLWGCDDSGANSSFPNQSIFAIDFFGFVWNQGFFNSQATPNSLKSRYW